MKIALFASGTGSNALKIIEHFHTVPSVSFVVLSNKENAPVLPKVQALNIPTLTFNRKDFYENGKVKAFLAEQSVDFIVLAGFLWLMPTDIVQEYPNKIINIHPALLPKFGGKGMYGMKVHEAVQQAQETTTGITIHYVNEKYDEGEVILQATCAVAPTDTPEMIAKKVQALEHEHFPKVVEKLIGK
jgi:phosphoribosylglycinamide formyltransferase-1